MDDCWISPLLSLFFFFFFFPFFPSFFLRRSDPSIDLHIAARSRSSVVTLLTVVTLLRLRRPTPPHWHLDPRVTQPQPRKADRARYFKQSTASSSHHNNTSNSGNSKRGWSGPAQEGRKRRLLPFADSPRALPLLQLAHALFLSPSFCKIFIILRATFELNPFQLSCSFVKLARALALVTRLKVIMNNASHRVV